MSKLRMLGLENRVFVQGVARRGAAMGYVGRKWSRGNVMSEVIELHKSPKGSILRLQILCQILLFMWFAKINVPRHPQVRCLGPSPLTSHLAARGDS